MILSFVIYGEAVSQGSKRAVQPKGHMRPIVIDDNPKELMAWRSHVINGARAARVEAGIERPFGASIVALEFYFARPAGHYGAHGNLLPSAPSEKITKPDLDKLVRAMLDSLEQAYVLQGDNTVVEIHAKKEFGEPRVEVEVTELGGGLNL